MNNRLYSVRDGLLDEVAEECRLANLTPQKAQKMVDFIEEQFKESERLVRENKADIEDVIVTFRGLIKMLLKTPDCSYID